MTLGASISESVEVRVPAKAILAGEHFVLYGAQAVAAPVPTRALTLRAAIRPGARLALPEPFHELAPAISRLFDDRLNGFIRLSCTSDIPQGAGLGSSAAFSVALGRALVLIAEGGAETSAFAQRGALPDSSQESKAMEIAQLVENRIHGRASGIDTAAVANSGGIVYSMEGESVVPLQVSKPLKFLLLDTGQRRATREQIEFVAQTRLHQSSRFEAAAVDASTQIFSLIDAMGDGDKRRIWESIDELGKLLAALGLETPGADGLRDRFGRTGIALKVTGAGGGGFLLGFSEDEDVYQQILSDKELAATSFCFSVPCFHESMKSGSGGVV